MAGFQLRTDLAGDRVLKLARTIADLTGEVQVQVNHLAEALQYRPRAVA